MMMYALGVAAAGIFAGLALLHLSWALRGVPDTGSFAVIPEIAGRPASTPPPLVTLGVACALFGAMLVVLGRLGVWGGGIPMRLSSWGTWALAALFLLRAIGDFRLVGFFKRVRGTRFARLDTRLYSPVCLALALALAIVAAG